MFQIYMFSYHFETTQTISLEAFSTFGTSMVEFLLPLALIFLKQSIAPKCLPIGKSHLYMLNSCLEYFHFQYHLLGS